MKKIIISALIGLGAMMGTASAGQFGIDEYFSPNDYTRTDFFFDSNSTRTAGALDRGYITNQEAVDIYIKDVNDGRYQVGTGWESGTHGEIVRDARPHWGLAREVYVPTGGF